MSITDFTYYAYGKMVQLIIDSGYFITDYHCFNETTNPCILRHDIDYDMKKAFDLARFENSGIANYQVRSTYFVLLTSEFYNVLSKDTNKILQEILTLGHTIGLHFDETRYFSSPSLLSSNQEELIIRYINEELAILEQVIERPVTVVSMHRPSKATLEANLVIPGVINSYGQQFFKEFKYISDSRHSWREDAEKIISSKNYRMLHILTHPFWYTENIESCRDKLFSFIVSANKKRYKFMDSNFTNINEFVRQEEV
jgi:hypothetical protein